MPMQTIAEVLKKIEDYSISNRAEFEALVKKTLVMQQKRIPQITTRLEQIDKVLNMQDETIVALYWQRDEKAISETERKYGRYLSKIAYNILSD